MIHIEYELIDSGEIERDFATVEVAKLWVRGIGEEYFKWVNMYINNGYDYDVIEGYMEIVNYGR